jgi:hypothetical protein
MFITDVAVVAMMLPFVLGLLEAVQAKPGSRTWVVDNDGHHVRFNMGGICILPVWLPMFQRWPFN